MSQVLHVELSDEVFAGILLDAQLVGTTPARVAEELLAKTYRGAGGTERHPSKDPHERATAAERFEQHFGSVDLGHATGADNESIDADLAREYAGNHAEE